MVKLAEEDDRVEMAENDLNHGVTRMQTFSLPQDPRYLEQWQLHTRLDDPEVDERSSSQCEEAWEIFGNFGRPEVVVGVTDDGCRLDHLDFGSAACPPRWLAGQHRSYLAGRGRTGARPPAEPERRRPMDPDGRGSRRP